MNDAKIGGVSLNMTISDNKEHKGENIGVVKYPLSLSYAKIRLSI